MEREIGDRFKCNGAILEVVEQDGCDGCHFTHPACKEFWKIRGTCGPYREDGKFVIFERVDKHLLLLAEAYEELIRCGIETEIVDKIQKFLIRKIPSNLAYKHDNEKGFLVIRTESLFESINLGRMTACDSCNKGSHTGYYIAVMNEWFCDKCFYKWYNRAKRYPEDMEIEERNYQRHAQIFNL